MKDERTVTRSFKKIYPAEVLAGESLLFIKIWIQNLYDDIQAKCSDMGCDLVGTEVKDITSWDNRTHLEVLYTRTMTLDETTAMVQRANKATDKARTAKEAKINKLRKLLAELEGEE